MTARKAPIEESFDAFWEELTGGSRTTVIEGVTVPVPVDLPLGFGERFTALQASESDEDAAELVALLFGQAAADQWLAPPKIGTRKLMTVLLWGMAQAAGEDLSFAEAYERLRTQAGTGKAPNRQARRAAQKKPSAGTGGRSRPTSSASTGTAPATSRA
ncbi:hypothetical protein [Streptomyces albipurpureus]|uniref:Tail assembly chaperone n=1 Tax=Streptomyces albipurpureus TaxID=2897419 RepID=A0ABT0V0I9_9ACTN|nr:hypothetical protein [Streptomyces sp. CWNU-1]MCM2394363.1 hypothetical protein [Streptomyces sp. CWNU-1]